LNAGRAAIFHSRLGSGEELERQQGGIDFSVHVSAVSCPRSARRVTLLPDFGAMQLEQLSQVTNCSIGYSIVSSAVEGSVGF
jgi:hypothetical protein